MAEESVLFEINLKDSLTKLAELKQQLDGLKENQKSLADAFDKGAVSAEDYAKGTEAVKVATKNVSAEYRSAQRLLEGYTGAQKDGIDTTNLANNSVRQNRLLLKQLTEQYNNTKNPTEAFANQIKNLSDTLKRQESAIGDTRRNVGNYEGALAKATGQIKIFGQSIGTITAKYDESKKALQDAKQKVVEYIAGQTALDGVTKASIFSIGGLNAVLNLTRIALIATGVGAFVVLLGSLVAAFATTQKGVDFFNEKLTILKSISSALLGSFQVLGEKIIDVFNNPKKALTDLVDLIQTNLTNRLKSFGVILDGILNRDFDKIRSGVQQMATGIEDLEGKLSKAGQAASNFFGDAAAKGAEINRLRKDAEKLEVDINRQRAEYESREKDLLIIAKSAKTSDEDRKKATDELLKNADELSKKEQAIIAAKIKALKLEQSLSDTGRKGQKELQDLEASLIKARDIGKEKQLSLIKLLNKEEKEGIKNAENAAKEKLNAEKKYREDVLKLQDEFLLSEREKLEKSFDAKAATITGTSEKELQLLKAINDAKTAALIKFDDDTAKKLNDARDAQERERIQKELTRINEQTSLQSILRDNELKEVELSVASEQDKIKRKKEINLAYLERQLDLAIQLGLADDKLTDTEIANIERLKLAIRELKENVAEPTPTISEVLGINETELNNAASALGGFQQLVGSLAQTFSALNQQRLNDIQTQYDTEIANVNRSALNKEEKEKKIAELERQKAREKYEQELAAFKTSKALQIVNATIATALAVIQGLQTGFSIPIVGVGLGPALAIAAAAAGAVQIGIIASQKPPAPPAFAEGGKVLSGKVIGNNDGVPIQRSNGDNLLATVKTGEVILNQRQQAALGGAATFRKIGVPGFATGGIVGDGGFTARSMTRASDERAFIKSAIRSGFMNAPQPVVTVEEINRVSDSSTNSVEVSEL